MNHYGYQKTISTFEELAKQYDDMGRQREQLEGDGSWREVWLCFLLFAHSLEIYDRVRFELALSKQ